MAPTDYHPFQNLKKNVRCVFEFVKVMLRNIGLTKSISYARQFRGAANFSKVIYAAKL